MCARIMLVLYYIRWGNSHHFYIQNKNMSAVVRSEFALALNQVATERGIDPESVIETIKAAILAAYRKDYGGSDLEKLEVKINPDTGEAKIFLDKKDITPAGFGRIATQTAKQVILQRIREAEKKAIIGEYTAKVGTIINGMVLRFDGPNIIVDIGRAETVMPPQEQIPNEHYRLNQRLTFYIEGIRESMKGNQIIVSRAHKGLVAGLFQREVPEVSNGSVQIKEMAREAGHRCKIAVSSTSAGVDPVGSCVGQKGVRVQAVINELGGLEKVDIIQWGEDQKLFIQTALAPAKDIEIILSEKKKTAIALVPDDQLSLAIGKEGQNVRLAGKLTGWKIDIKPKSQANQIVPAAVSDDTTSAAKTDDTKKTKSAKKSSVGGKTSRTKSKQPPADNKVEEKTIKE